MPVVSAYTNDPAVDGRQSETALEIQRGVMIGFLRANITCVPEFTLPNGRRADLIGLSEKGEISIIEIKSSVADFNVDQKWHEYKDYCDQFYFASHPSVPQEIFPESEGFILADKYGCEVLRESDVSKLAAATRKSLTLKLARATGRRLQKMLDFHGPETD